MRVPTLWDAVDTDGEIWEATGQVSDASWHCGRTAWSFQAAARSRQAAVAQGVPANISRSHCRAASLRRRNRSPYSPPLSPHRRDCTLWAMRSGAAGAAPNRPLHPRRK